MENEKMPTVHEVDVSDTEISDNLQEQAKTKQNKKQPKPGRFKKFLSILLPTLVFLSIIGLTFSLFYFDKLNLKLKAIAMILLVLFTIVIILLRTLLARTRSKKVGNIITNSVLVLILVATNFTNFYYYKVFGALSEVTNGKEYIKFVLVVPKDSDITSTDMLNGRTIGFQTTDSQEGTILPTQELKKKGIDFSVENYQSYPAALDAMLEFQQVDALILPSLKDPRILEQENYKKVDSMVKVIETFSVEITSENTSKVNMATEPFSILISGIDSRTGSIEDNTMSDVIMVVTVNPQTKHVSMISVPRDSYVPIACNGNAKDKITHSGASGIQCTVDSIENLFNTEIDHYIKIDFRGVLSIVDALGGIEVDVPETMDGVCEQNSSDVADSICFKAGTQTLDGEHALALARHRYTLLRGDFDRNMHQQLVLSAMISKLAHSGPDMINPLLSAMSGNIKTDLSNEQMIQLMQLGISSTSSSSPYSAFGAFFIQRVEIVGGSIDIGDGIYYFQPNYDSIQEAIQMISDIKNANSRPLPDSFVFSFFSQEAPR